MSDGRDAYDYAVSGDYDGIILDIMMPGRDGIEVLTALRKKGIHTPILLLTAKAEIEDRIRGLSDGLTVELTSGLTTGDTYYYACYDTPDISETPDFGSGFSRLPFGK